MAEPISADGTAVPADETESGRAKHVAPIEDEQPDHPAVARAATGPDAADHGPAERTGADEPLGAPAVTTPAAAAPAVAADRSGESVRPPSSEAETREEPTVQRYGDRTAVLPERASAAEPVAETDTREVDATPTDAARTAVLPAESRIAPPPPPPAPQRTTPVPPADAPAPPRRGSNRLVGTAWVLLAALLFEVLYLAAYALLILVAYGSSSVAPALAALNRIGLTWLPVVLFALFYELTVLLLNRAGRFAYVLSSLIVAAILYLLTAFLALAMQPGGLGNESNFGQALIVPQIVLIPLVAREVMLWTGLAVGARGRRLRRRNREAQEQYERERFARSVQDDGGRTSA